MWKKRICYDRGCANDACFSDSYVEKELVEECASECGCGEPVCGDNVVNQAWEECDNGLLNGVACVPPYDGNCTYCSLNCANVFLEGGYCGDNVVQTDYEECDDGNNNNGDGCDENCELEGIECSKDSDCGEDYWHGEEICVCGVLLDNYTEYECIDPGTEDSYCDEWTYLKIKGSCDKPFGC